MPEMTLPLGTHVVYRGMTGREEDLLTKDKKMRTGEAIDELMAGCVKSITTGTGDDVTTKEVVQVGDIQRLKTPERIALLLAIRQESYGDNLDVELQCRSCSDTILVSVDLGQVEHVVCPEDYDAEFGFEITLGDGDERKKVRFDYMDGRRERSLAKQRDNIMTFAMLARLKEVEGIHKNDLRKWLLDLPVRLRHELRNKMAEKECGPNTEVVADCTSCGVENSFNVHGQRGFFFPVA